MKERLLPEQAAAAYAVRGVCTSHKLCLELDKSFYGLHIMSKSNCNRSRILHNIGECEACLMYYVCTQYMLSIQTYNNGSLVLTCVSYPVPLVL